MDRGVDRRTASRLGSITTSSGSLQDDPFGYDARPPGRFNDPTRPVVPSEPEQAFRDLQERPRAYARQAHEAREAWAQRRAQAAPGGLCEQDAATPAPGVQKPLHEALAGGAERPDDDAGWQAFELELASVMHECRPESEAEHRRAAQARNRLRERDALPPVPENDEGDESDDQPRAGPRRAPLIRPGAAGSETIHAALGLIGAHEGDDHP